MSATDDCPGLALSLIGCAWRPAVRLRIAVAKSLAHAVDVAAGMRRCAGPRGVHIQWIAAESLLAAAAMATLGFGDLGSSGK